MTRLLLAGLLAAATAASAQEPVIKRSAPMTLTGEIVAITCYRANGVAGGTGAAGVACGRPAILEQGSDVGILSDGDGLFRIWGASTKDKFAKLLPFLGQQVEITGTEVVLSNNYDARSFDLQNIKRKGK